MCLFRVLVTSVLAFTCIGPIAAQPKKAEWSPKEMMQIQKITSVQVSPDGKRVAYAVREADMTDSKSEYLTHVYLANIDGSGTIQLTTGDKSCDEPQWSPDGKWIGFLSRKTPKRNLWIISPTDKNAAQVTNMKSDVTSFQWSADSMNIAFTAKAPPTPEEETAKKAKNDARVVDENIKMNRLFVIQLPQGDKPAMPEPRLVTPGAGSVASGARGGYSWSKDGAYILFSRTRTPHADHWTTLDIYLCDVAKGIATPFSNSLAAEYAPHISPDGKSLAYVVTDDPPKWAGAAQVCVCPSAGGLVTRLDLTHDGFGRYSDLIGWSADSKYVYFTEVQGTVTRVGRLPIKGSPEILGSIDGIASDIHLNAAGTHFGFTWESLDRPPEAAISSVDRFEPITVSKVNAGLPKHPLGKTEVIRWKSKDGLEIEGLLTYPANYQKGKTYPLLLNVHGGPMGVFTQTFVASPGLYPIATFSSRGYAVLRPNPRGSSGYGKKFRYANYNDWGGGDYLDCITGVDHVIKMGVADEKRLGVMGWSYGGFMTSWIITQTPRFKAASVGAGVTNLMSFTGTADIPGFLPDYFGGEFWDKPDVYKKHSAMFNIKGVKTPTLIQHGEKDERVPLSQGLELYNALKRQRCETKMVIYPRMPHSIEEPRLLVDCMERNLDWFATYLGGW